MSNNFSRRNFLKVTAGASIAFSIPSHLVSNFSSAKRKIKIGVITDLHQDIMHDGTKRMQAFLGKLGDEKADAIFQLGDFAYPGDKNKEVIELYNNAHKNAYHVIGNHDTDAGYTKDQCINYWGMPSAYYTTKVGEITFIVLDGNDKGSPTSKGGYASYIGEPQKKWLAGQLEEISGPIVITSHQPLAGYGAVDNAEAIQDLLSNHSDQILFAMNGHTHVDVLLKRKGITYLHFNSASYLWVGGDYKNVSYSEEIHKEYPWIASTCPYVESLFAFVTIDLEKSLVEVRGKSTDWVGTPPHELGVSKYPLLVLGEEVAPKISDRKMYKLSEK